MTMQEHSCELADSEEIEVIEGTESSPGNAAGRDQTSSRESSRIEDEEEEAEDDDIVEEEDIEIDQVRGEIIVREESDEHIKEFHDRLDEPDDDMEEIDQRQNAFLNSGQSFGHGNGNGNYQRDNYRVAADPPMNAYMETFNAKNIHNPQMNHHKPISKVNLAGTI